MGCPPALGLSAALQPGATASWCQQARGGTEGQPWLGQGWPQSTVPRCCGRESRVPTAPAQGERGEGERAWLVEGSCGVTGQPQPRLSCRDSSSVGTVSDIHKLSGWCWARREEAAGPELGGQHGSGLWERCRSYTSLWQRPTMSTGLGDTGTRQPGMAWAVLPPVLAVGPSPCSGAVPRGGDGELGALRSPHAAGEHWGRGSDPMGLDALRSSGCRGSRPACPLGWAGGDTGPALGLTEVPAVSRGSPGPERGSNPAPLCSLRRRL